MSNFTPQEIEEFLQEFFDVVGARHYVGARYVPIFGRAGESTVEWDNEAPYEPLTVVMHVGVSYVSRRYVPRGIEIENTDYWVQTYRFNAQVEQYRQEVLGFQDDIDDLRSDTVPFPDGETFPKYGTTGQVLSTLGDGKTEWVDPVVPSDEQAEAVITQWLDDHPEATTTVQDGSVTDAKLAQYGIKLHAIQFDNSTTINWFVNNYGSYGNAPGNTVFRFQARAGGNAPDEPSSVLGTLVTLGFSGEQYLRVQYYVENVSHGNIFMRIQTNPGTGVVWGDWAPLVPETDLSDYLHYLGSYSVAQLVSMYTSLDDMPNNTSINLQTYGGQSTIPGAPTNQLGIAFTFGTTATPLKTQLYIETHGSVRNMYSRRQNVNQGTVEWLAWDVVGYKPTPTYIIDKAGGGDNTSLLEGILYCNANGITDVRVRPGTYDMVAEYTAKYGSSWDTDLGNDPGIPLGYGIRLVFDDGAKVIFNYTGGRSNIHTHLSMFNTVASDCYMEGLDLECANLRYGIHDDCSYASTPYIHTFKNCRIRKVDTNSDWTASCCIAGGFGSSARVEIDGGMYMNNNTTQQPSAVSDSIYYHNNAALTGSSATVDIHGVYCYGPKGSLHSGGQIQQDGSVATMLVHGCRFNAAPREQEPLAIVMHAWNNVVESD